MRTEKEIKVAIGLVAIGGIDNENNRDAALVGDVLLWVLGEDSSFTQFVNESIASGRKHGLDIEKVMPGLIKEKLKDHSFPV